MQARQNRCSAELSGTNSDRHHFVEELSTFFEVAPVIVLLIATSLSLHSLQPSPLLMPVEVTLP